jgi:hypothetical protein
MENIKKGNERKKHNLRGCANLEKDNPDKYNLDKDNHEKLVKLFELPKLSENDSAKQNESRYLRQNCADHPSTCLRMNKKTSHWVMFEHVPVAFDHL